MNTKNKVASIAAKLKSASKENGVAYQQLLTRYGLERFLFRLVHSTAKDQFLLKGALLFNLWHNMPTRPTRDIDLLGFGNVEQSYIHKLFTEICQIQCNDGIIFDPKTVSVKEIRKEEGYPGVRVTCFGFLGKAKCPVQVDIGYGDAVTPEPIHENFPLILEEDVPSFSLLTYPVYTVVAEKLEAIAKLGMANSRMKDYFDVYVILKHQQLDLKLLEYAITQTFNRRGTELMEVIPTGLTEEFYKNKRVVTQWQAFINKNNLVQLELSEVVASICGHLTKMGLTDN